MEGFSADVIKFHRYFVTVFLVFTNNSHFVVVFLENECQNVLLILTMVNVSCLSHEIAISPQAFAFASVICFQKVIA